MNLTKIPQELKNLEQWVCAWDSSKCPMKAYEYGAASSTNPDTWDCFEQAAFAVNEGHYDYLGFVFNNNGIVGIDIDIGFDDFGLMTDVCADIMEQCHSYTEKSKSRRGVHILLHGSLPFDGKNNLKGIEIYKAKRFFIMTGDTFFYDKIIDNQEAIDYVVQKYFSDLSEGRESASKGFSQRIYAPIYKSPSEGHIRLKPIYPDIQAGGRNLSLASLAGSMHTTGYKARDILNELNMVNQTCCKPPLPDREVQKIVESITSYRR